MSVCRVRTLKRNTKQDIMFTEKGVLRDGRGVRGMVRSFPTLPKPWRRSKLIGSWVARSNKPNDPTKAKKRSMQENSFYSKKEDYRDQLWYEGLPFRSLCVGPSLLVRDCWPGPVNQ